MSDTPQPKVGDTVFVFDINRRVYPKPEAGRSYSTGGPIYRHHWRESKIFAETSRSWILDYAHGRKVPKKGERRGVAFTMQEIEDDVWAHDHKYKIADLVQRTSASNLRKIAEIVGYKEKPEQ